MSGWASVAIELGARVSGSDRADSPALGALRARGADVHAGHDAANLPAGDDVEVVYSTAIPADNPELVLARERGLRVMARAELLRELTSLKRTIAVAGAHGKTTTTSMTAHVLLGCGLDPGYLIGGTLGTTGRNAAWGSGEWLVVEADESDRSMLALERRHRRRDERRARPPRQLRLAPRGPRRVPRVPRRAAQAVILDRPELLELRGDAPRRRLRRPRARARADGLAVRLARPGGAPRGARRAQRAQRGRGARGRASLAGADPQAAVAALATFAGAGRRFESLGRTASGAHVVDDYAHHPTEVAATIAAARTLRPRRLVAVFQPHLYSRTQHLAGAFGRALAGADVVVRARRLPGARARGGLPGRQRAHRRRGRRRRGTRARGAVAARRSTTPSASCARACARATCCSSSARATCARSGERLVAS